MIETLHSLWLFRDLYDRLKIIMFFMLVISLESTTLLSTPYDISQLNSFFYLKVLTPLRN